MSKKSTEAKAICATLIAPCGMNCRLCLAYVRGHNPCPGCRGDDTSKPKTRIACPIKNCERVAGAEGKYCSSCESLPCGKLDHLDKRYRTKYGMSMIDNLEIISKFGIRNFIKREKEKWTCPECGEIICVHKENCIACGYSWR